MSDDKEVHRLNASERIVEIDNPFTGKKGIQTGAIRRVRWPRSGTGEMASHRRTDLRRSSDGDSCARIDPARREFQAHGCAGINERRLEIIRLDRVLVMLLGCADKKLEKSLDRPKDTGKLALA
jgi:hypothetical protein